MPNGLTINLLVTTTLAFWGAWGIFDKKALETTTPLGQLMAVYAFCPLVILTTGALLTMLSPGWTLSNHTLLYTALGAVASITAILSYLVAMTRGEASLVLGATAAYPVGVQILAHFVLGEALVPIRVLGCAVLVAGVIILPGLPRLRKAQHPTPAPQMQLQPELVAVAAKTSTTSAVNSTAPAEELKSILDERAAAVPQKQNQRRKNNALICAIGIALSIIGWSARCIFDKIAVEQAAPFEVFLGKYICDTICGIIVFAALCLRHIDLKLDNRKSWQMALGSAVCLGGGTAAYFVALSMASASYVITITGCYPLVMYLLAIFILKEKFHFSRAIGIAMITVGGILTQMTQNL